VGGEGEQSVTVEPEKYEEKKRDKKKMMKGNRNRVMGKLNVRATVRNPTGGRYRMKSIKLQNSSRVVVVDDDRYEELSRDRWRETKAGRGKTTYAWRNERQPDGTTLKVLMHRQILGLGPGSPLQVDHVDGRGLVNLVENLRVATRSQNQANKALSRHSTSGFKGVSCHKASRRWIANASHQGKSVYLGLYDTAVEAAVAYNLAAERLYGAFARPNVIPVEQTPNPETVKSIRRKVISKISWLLREPPPSNSNAA